MSKQKKDNAHQFQPGNKLWELVDPDNLGRPSKYETPEKLWQETKEYFAYCDANPWKSKETKTDGAKKTDTKITLHTVPYTWEGLYVFLGICNLVYYKEKDEFSYILTTIKDIIYNQKYVGASTGVFKENLIIRDLGLKDNQNVNHGGQAGNPIEITKFQIPDNNRDKKSS